MGETKPRFTEQEHERTGEELSNLRDRALTLHTRIDNAFPRGTKLARQAKSIVGRIDALEAALTRELDAAFPNCPRPCYRRGES